MGHRVIGQEVMGFARSQRRGGLDDLDAAIDWAPIEARLGRIYASERGERAWPPLALLKALVLAQLYDLSDVALSEALDDRASFRRFCGFSASEPVPERTAFVRFRRELVNHRVDRGLLNAVVRQLDAQGLTVRTGTLVDATIIRAARPDDRQAGWNVYGKDGAMLGWKAHVATDEGGDIVREVAVTPANVDDASGMLQILDRHPGRVWADKGYDQVKLRRAIARRNGVPRIMRRIWTRSRPHWNAAKRAWNKGISTVRGKIEKVFGTAKRSYGLDRARYLGRRKMSLQAHLIFIAYNLRRAVALPPPTAA